MSVGAVAGAVTFGSRISPAGRCADGSDFVLPRALIRSPAVTTPARLPVGCRWVPWRAPSPSARGSARRDARRRWGGRRDARHSVPELVEGPFGSDRPGGTRVGPWHGRRDARPASSRGRCAGRPPGAPVDRRALNNRPIGPEINGSGSPERTRIRVRSRSRSTRRRRPRSGCHSRADRRATTGSPCRRRSR